MKLQTSAALLFLCVIACRKKDKEVEPLIPTKENLSGDYRIEKVMGRGANSPEADVTTLYYTGCELDNTYSLKAADLYVVYDEGNLCGGPMEYEGEWNLVNSTTIEIDGRSYSIKAFDGDKLQISHVFGDATLVEHWDKR